jgi:membrane protein
MAAITELFKKTYREWSEDKAPRLGAALSYYTIFSIAPLIVIVVAIAGFFFGTDAVQGEMRQTMTGMLGESGAHAIDDMVSAASHRGQGTVATIVGMIMLIAGASGVFGELQSSLNTIWEVEPKPNRGFWGLIRDRFLSLTMVLGTAFLLLVSLVISTALGAMQKYSGGLPGGEMIWHVVNIGVSFAIISLMFALIFKYVPDATIGWRDVWIGALVTAALFIVGKTAIGLYLGRSSVSSAYGAAGSLAIVLLWVYYVSQIFFFGAEFTQVYANTHGSRVEPEADAIPLTDEAREQQGAPHRDEGGYPVRSGRAQTRRAIPPSKGDAERQKSKRG